MSKQSILFCASEVYPFAKTGGLGDVAHSLPRALSDAFDVTVVMPLYSSINREHFDIRPLGKNFEIRLNALSYPVELYHTNYEGIEYIFIYTPLLCEREYLYGPPTHGYEDNALRFALFNYAILSLLKENSYEIAHLNDWQSALVALLVKEDSAIETKTLFTIHNLAYQGVFPRDVLESINIDERYFTMDALEFYGQVNFMKAGISYADRVTTVSPTYAKEILTPAFGSGLEGFLLHHKEKLSGILNGIDSEHFSPVDDALLLHPFHDAKGKAPNKKAYLKEIGLKGIKKPLFVFIGRLTHQKGVDLLIETLAYLALQECNIAIIGEGEERYSDTLRELSAQHSNIHFEATYNEALSHRMYGAADFLLMPSLFEPCGLNQMIAMSYGAIPIVHKVGGLGDSVKNFKKFNKASPHGYGILFQTPTTSAFLRAIMQALELYKVKKDYNSIARHNMLCDFSFSASAKMYTKLYKQLNK